MAQIVLSPWCTERKKAMKSIERERLDRLYDLMKREERAGREDEAANLRWAIFELERIFGR